MWDIKTLKKEFKLNKLYQELNEKYFKGVLGEVKFESVPDPCTFIPAVAAIYKYKKRTGKKTATIKFNSRVDWNEQDIRRVLLHEMIHYYIFIKFRWSVMFPHGLPFIWEMLRINICYNEHIRMFWHKEKLTWSDNQPC